MLADEGKRFLGIGIDTEMALAIDRNGIGRVYGEGAISFVHPTDLTQIQFVRKRPPYITAVKIAQLMEDFPYDVRTRQLVDVPPQARLAGVPPQTLHYRRAIISGADDNGKQLGQWWAD